MGGVATHMDGLARHLKLYGHHPIIVTSKLPYYDSNNGYPFKVIKIKGRVFPFFDIAPIGTYGRLRNIINKNYFDIVHGHHAFTPISLYSVDLARKNGIPSILTAHSFAPAGGAIFWLALSKFAFPLRGYLDQPVKIIAVSYAVRKFMLNWVSDPDKIVVVPNGIQTDLYDLKIDQQELRKKLNIPEDAFVFLYVGRLVLRKGPIILLKAFKKLVKEHPNTHLYYIGVGELASYLITRIKQMGLKNNVHYLGYVLNGKLLQYYNAVDTVVVPSLFGEAFGLVLIEAMSAGKPVIATRVGGMTEIVSHNKNGLLCSPNSVDELYNAMKLLYEDQNFARKMGTNGKIIAKKRYDWSVVTKKILNVYNEAKLECENA